MGQAQAVSNPEREAHHDTAHQHLETRRLRHAARLAAALLVAGLVVEADAAVLCGRTNSAGEIAEGATIKLRSVCRDNELAVNPLDVGLQAQPTLVVRTGNTVSTNGVL